MKTVLCWAFFHLLRGCATPIFYIFGLVSILEISSLSKSSWHFGQRKGDGPELWIAEEITFLWIFRYVRSHWKYRNIISSR